jgi:hypothetical protein
MPVPHRGFRGIKSNLLLPVTRIAAAVKTGNDQEGIGFDEKKERVGSSARLDKAHRRAPRVLHFGSPGF